MSAPPFRAEHIGSLLRPPRLLQDRSLADECIAEAIRWQESLGLEVVTDGEFRRESWRLGFVSKVAGFARAEAWGNVDLQRDDAGNVMRVGEAPVAVTRVRRTGPFVADEVAFSLNRAGQSASTATSTPISSNSSTTWCGFIGMRSRPCTPPAAAISRSTRWRRRCCAIRSCATRCARAATIRAVRERPAGMTVGVHMCRGNAMGKWIAEGGYERIAEKSFSRMEVDAFCLEFDSERAGGFEPLRFVPRGKRVVLGLLSTKIPALEGKDDLKRKIAAAARFVPLENLSISPQCGFASHEKGAALGFEHQEAKLRRVVETAAEVWGHA
ncbi:MAG TPA: hypothetical protein VLF42_12545 [Burkholderiales bacterium]|nr:hypothetical protein [Burkholderiales bacterium]